MATYRMHIAGLDRDLPICKVTDDFYIGAFIMFGDAVRYGVMILTAGVLWPLTFRWFGRLGRKKADTLQ